MLKGVKVAVLGLACIAMLASGGCRAKGSVVSGPTAVVLNMAPKPALHFVDLATGKDVARVKLRSSSTDMDARSGMVVTAQCGGVSTDADDVIGVYDTTQGGRVRYFKSVAPNPLDATMITSSTALVSNGWLDKDGLVVALVDVRLRKTLREGRVPNMTNSPVVVGGTLWSPGVYMDGSQRELRRIDAATLESVVVTVGPESPAMIVGDREDPSRMFAIKWWDRHTSPRRVEVQRFDGTAESLAVPGITYDFADGPGRSAMIGDVLAVADFNDEGAPDHGRHLMLLRPGISDEVRKVSFPGGAASICVWRGKFLVLESQTGRIYSVDPESGAKRRIGAVEGSDRMLIDMAVLD